MVNSKLITQDLKLKKGSYQSGQMGQTVNLLSFDFGGSNPSLPTSKELIIENRKQNELFGM